MKFISMLKQLSVNIRFDEALEQMPNYVKFVKDFVTKKIIVDFDMVDDRHHCSAKVLSSEERRFGHVHYYLYYW